MTKTIEYNGYFLEVFVNDDELFIYEGNEDITHEFSDADITYISQLLDEAMQEEYEDNKYERLKGN